MATITFTRSDGQTLTVDNAEVSYGMDLISTGIQIPNMSSPIVYSMGGVMRKLTVRFILRPDDTNTEIGQVVENVLSFFGKGNIGDEYTITVNDWVTDPANNTVYEEKGVLRSVEISQKGGELAVSVRVSFIIGQVIL